VSEMPLLENVGFENPTYGCYQPSFSASFSQVSKPFPIDSCRVWGLDSRLRGNDGGGGFCFFR
ncbi:hypothetical protein F7O82_11550, partial [Neisseria meningitidis]|nr:hypothetical protein [Neisseria meningitidis]